MKIGYLLQVGEEIRQPPYNGPANHVRQVFQELHARGHEVKILFRLEGKIWKSADLQHFSQVVVPQIDQGVLRWFERGIRRFQYQLKLPYLGFFESLRFALACNQELPDRDIFYERLSWMTYGGALVSRWKGIPLVLEYNGDPLSDLESKNQAPHGIQRWLSVRLMRWAISKASHVIATGEGWRASCVRDWGVPREGVTTVENGTDLVDRIPRETIRSFRIDINLDTPVRLVYLGGFYRWHGTDILLRVLKCLIGQGMCFHLDLIGAGDGLEETQSLTRELGLEGVVTFWGRLSAQDYSPILADADIGLSPYCGWQEFSGLKLFDYKAAGLASIASGKDNQPHTLTHGSTGWIVPPCDEEALADAIRYLTANSELRRQIGRAARLEAERMHTWTHTAEKIEEILERFVNL